MYALLKKTGLVLPVVLVLLFVVLLSPGCKKQPAENEQPEVIDTVDVNQPPEVVETQPQPAETQPVETQPAPAAPTTKTIYAKQLDEIDQMDAEEMMANLPAGKKIGALPMTSYSLMVVTCRQILQRWPDSLYAYKAKLALAGLSEQDKRTFKITNEETDVSAFEKTRTGTQPYTVQ